MRKPKSKSKIMSIKRFLEVNLFHKIHLLSYRAYLKYMLYRDKLVPVDNKHRGMGKSELLLCKAEKKQIPILVGNETTRKNYMYRKPTVTVYTINDSNASSLNEIRFSNGALIDESVTKEMTEFISKAYPNAIKIRGGHVPNYNKI